jgi:hypothetical protein
MSTVMEPAVRPAAASSQGHVTARNPTDASPLAKWVAATVVTLYVAITLIPSPDRDDLIQGCDPGGGLSAGGLLPRPSKAT